MIKIVKKSNEKDRKYAKILGINVISSSTSSLLTSVEHFISYNRKFSILTPNSELVVMAQHDKRLKESLNTADLPVPDTVGLKYASIFLFGKNLNIIPGRKLFIDLVNLARRKGWRVFLLGGLDNEAELAAKKIRAEYFKGPRLNQKAEAATEIDRRLDRDAIERINKFAPQLLFVAFGNPKQEIWIHKNLSKLNIGGAMAVGGTFRYLAGLSPLPPKWMETLGLEWLYRLFTEPFRFKRIWNAVVVFPLKVFWSKIVQETT